MSEQTSDRNEVILYITIALGALFISVLNGYQINVTVIAIGIAFGAIVVRIMDSIDENNLVVAIPAVLVFTIFISIAIEEPVLRPGLVAMFATAAAIKLYEMSR